MPMSLESSLPPKVMNTIALGALAYSLAIIARRMLEPRVGLAVTESPLKTLLPNLSEKERANLPYPDDALPGSRDVSSPYGSTRVYEWGPESGRKVLLVHGISTPCIALGGIAHELVDRGCRVMLFDLFGRGFSDNPDDLPQDPRLFCSQILIALASSSLSWTGNASGRFALIGYSLGGGIAASFTSYFPDLISALILVTPSGLLRPNQVSLRTKLLYSQVGLPEPILTYLVRQRLHSSIAPSRSSILTKAKIQPTEPIKAEVAEYKPNTTAVLSRKYPQLTAADIALFQAQQHQAYVQAYMSSMRYGPIMTEYATWSRIGKRLSVRQDAEAISSSAVTLDRGRVLIVCANQDTSIVSSELVPDATAAFDGNVEFLHFEAGHDVPISKAAEVAASIWEFLSC